MPELFYGSGLLLLDKAAGISSAKALAQLKHKLGIAKIGHAGTLDPMATGLLICMLNDATKVAAYAEAGEKIYSGAFKFGLTTDTDDITGNPLKVAGFSPPFAQIAAAVPKFLGQIEQVPPAYSAIKVNGQRSYDLARQGQAVDLKSRIVNIFDFVVRPKSADEVEFAIRCSKGTYIRSLARDLGEMLGCGAVLSSLRREGSYPFSVVDAKTIDQISPADLIPVQALFPDVPSLLVDAADCVKLLNGDQQLLRDLGESFANVKDAPNKFICLDKLSRRIVSLVVRQDGIWQYAASFRS